MPLCSTFPISCTSIRLHSTRNIVANGKIASLRSQISPSRKIIPATIQATEKISCSSGRVRKNASRMHTERTENIGLLLLGFGFVRVLSQMQVLSYPAQRTFVRGAIQLVRVHNAGHEDAAEK